MNNLKETKLPVLSFQHTMLPHSASDFLDLDLLHADLMRMGMKELAMQRNFDDFVHSLVSVQRVA
jgi:hypothetical protein